MLEGQEQKDMDNNRFYVPQRLVFQRLIFLNFDQKMAILAVFDKKPTFLAKNPFCGLHSQN